MLIDADWFWLRDARDWHKSERTHAPWFLLVPLVSVDEMIWMFLGPFKHDKYVIHIIINSLFELYVSKLISESVCISTALVYCTSLHLGLL